VKTVLGCSVAAAVIFVLIFPVSPLTTFLPGFAATLSKNGLLIMDGLVWFGIFAAILGAVSSLLGPPEP
jgi:hypothetical protein